MDNTQDIGVIEFRNYLLKPNASEGFRSLFNDKFTDPMENLGGFTLGQYQIENDADRFVWIRGFENMQTRLRFLNDFYVESEVWKMYRDDANSMIINSDNVFLLRPLVENGNLTETGGSIKRSVSQGQNDVLVVDFYTCNDRLERVIELFKNEYLPYLRKIGVSNFTCWISEMSENEFPRLPAFQDKNLFVLMTAYSSDMEYRSKTKAIDAPQTNLMTAMLELITMRHRLILFPN